MPDPDVPEQLAKLNFVYFRESDPFDATFASLIVALDTDLDWKKTHTRLLVRAKEWERKGKDRSFLLRGEDLHEAEKWQAEAGTKEPKATALHSHYILASRQAETRRQRFTLGSVAVALLVTVVLAIAALLQRNTARQQAAIARANWRRKPSWPAPRHRKLDSRRINCRIVAALVSRMDSITTLPAAFITATEIVSL